MISRRSRYAAGAILLFALAGAVAAESDPLGDTLGILAPQLDATSLDGTVVGSSLHVTIHFTQPLGVPVGGILELDTDGDPTTGGPSYVSFLCPNDTGMGVERRIDLFSAVGGTATVADGQWNPVGTAQVTQAGNDLIVSLPFSTLGPSLPARAAAVLGPAATEVTDCVPNQGSILLAPAIAEIPTVGPGGMIALFLMLGWVGARRAARR